MTKRLPVYLFVVASFFAACDQERELPNLNLEQDYQPLGIGNSWIYEVDETLYFGENDSESAEFFYQDRIRTSYLNEENEVVFIVSRSKSTDRENWVFELEYTLINRDNSLLRTANNISITALVFPPEIGRVWNGKAYQAEGEDEFELDQVDSFDLPGFEEASVVRVNQEDLDDEITIRDIRYEIFGKGIGLLEKYDEVVTYCSRNDCLGQQLINNGSKTHLKLVAYETN